MLLFFKLFVCEQVFEKEGVFGLVETEELAIDLIPLDRDILSLELPDFFRNFYLVHHFTYRAISCNRRV